MLNQRIIFTVLIATTISSATAFAQSTPLDLGRVTRVNAGSATQSMPPEPYSAQPNNADTFIAPPNVLELLFGGLRAPVQTFQNNASIGPDRYEPYDGQQATDIPNDRLRLDPKFQRQRVGYDGQEKPGTVLIDTRNRLLYLVEENGHAMRYGVGVGRPGFTWAGVKQVSAKREWPDWTPPEEMLQRRPDLPHFMAGGPKNPLGARAIYLGSSLYRIHGSNEPWTIGQAVSSGCIRMRNEDVIDLYNRVKVGTKVVVI